MNWISRGATSHQLDRKCPIISHIFSSIVTLIIDCLRTGWSQLPPQAAEQAENVRQRYGKDKTEGLNALHMNTQNATRCIALIKIKHFHRPLNFRVVERVSASWWLDRRWLCSKLDAPTKFWLRKEIDFTKKMKTQYQRPFRTHFRAKQMQLIFPKLERGQLQSIREVHWAEHLVKGGWRGENMYFLCCFKMIHKCQSNEVQLD